VCGIVGIFQGNGRPVDRDVLHRMNESQFHRGPDESGLHCEPGVGLGHRRLSIIDLAGGHQPLYNEDETVAVVFNGEIYNFRELERELTACGHSFRTRTDTEVIAHGWEEWGEDCVRRFRGMFAFAVWDRNRRTLFLARDRLGIKPLHYGVLPDGTLLFGSELKALTSHPLFPREVIPEAIEDYFAYGYVPDPRTVYRHALKLPPAHTLTVRDGHPVSSPRRYWDLSFDDAAGVDEATVSEAFMAQLRDAVDSHMVSDVPVGAFLSGGVDSSAVVALMAGLSPTPVFTTSISFGEAEFNEARYAERVARRYHTDHSVRQVNPDDFSLVEQLPGLYDEPFADSSAMPTYRVCQMARERVKVVLSGDGGDENFAGYRRYRWHMNEELLRRPLPQALRGPLFGALGRLYPKLDWAPKVLRAKSTFQSLAMDSIAGYFNSVSLVNGPQALRLFSDRLRRDLQGYRAVEVLRQHAKNGPADPLSMVQYLDFKTYLPGDILTKVDRASMAHSLEVRVPILDHHFVEWASGVPSSLKLRGQEGKYIMKKALRQLLDDDILYRRKMGFGVPVAQWFRGPLRQHVRERLLGPRLGDLGWFNMDYLKEVVDDHQAGWRDYSALIWSLLMFEGAMAETERSPREASVAAAVQGEA
jgi:asparagine synthase (glutamine-hydrolysing)